MRIMAHYRDKSTAVEVVGNGINDSQIILWGFCGDQLCIVMHRGAQVATGATVSS